MRSKITYVEERGTLTINNLTVPLPLPNEGKSYLVERSADGHLLAGDAEGNPLSPAEAELINHNQALYGLRFDPIPMTVGKPVGKRLKLDREVDEIPFVVGTREAAGKQQIILANIGKARMKAGELDLDGAVSGHVITNSDGTGYELVDYGIAQIAKNERVRGHRVQTSGGFVLVIRKELHQVPGSASR
jgi:hypothetical protein